MKEKEKKLGVFAAVAASVVAAATVVSIFGKKKKEEGVREEENSNRKRAQVIKQKRGRGFREITLNARQSRIYSYIKEHKEVVMGDIMSDFLEVSERTLRRDLVFMVESGLLRKTGSTKASKYIIK